MHFTTRLKKPVFTKKTVLREPPVVSAVDGSSVILATNNAAALASTDVQSDNHQLPNTQELHADAQVRGAQFHLAPSTPQAQTGDRSEDNIGSTDEAQDALSEEQVLPVTSRRKRQGIASPVELGFSGAAHARETFKGPLAADTAAILLRTNSDEANAAEDQMGKTSAIEAEDSILGAYGGSNNDDTQQTMQRDPQTLALRRYQSQQSAASSRGSIDAGSPVAAHHPMPTLHNALHAMPSAPVDTGVKADVMDIRVASTLRKKLEGQKDPFRLGAALPIDTSAGGPTNTLDNCSPVATAPSQLRSAVSSPGHLTQTMLPKLPQGVSLKQLRASQTASYSFPRRSPTSTSHRLTVSAPRSASANDAKGALGEYIAPMSSSSMAVDPHFRRLPAWTTPDRPSEAPASASNAHLAPTSPAWRDAGTASPTSSTFTTDASGLRSPRSQCSPSSPLAQTHRVQPDEISFSAARSSPVLKQYSTGRSVLQKDKPNKALGHSRSFSGLSRNNSLLSKRRPSLPTNSLTPEPEAVVQLGNAQFEFVTPSAVKTPPLDRNNLSASTCSASIANGWQTPEHVNALDYDTDTDGTDLSVRLLVTRPTTAAKERIRSMYIHNQYEEPHLKTDQYGFVHHDPRSIERELEMSQSQDPKALEAYRARELKVRLSVPLSPSA